MQRTYLDPKIPTRIEPRADGLVEGLTSCCLDITPKNAAVMGKGRHRGAWWFIWMAVVVLEANLAILALYGGAYDAAVIAALTVVAFGLISLWPVQVWRGQHPMRFCRHDRNVYFHYHGRSYVTPWDEIRAYLVIQHGINPQGVPIYDPQINIQFPRESRSPFTAYLLAPETMGHEPKHQAAALWEYIRVYMEEGPASLPRFDATEDQLRWEGLVSLSTPLPVFRIGVAWLKPVEALIFFPLRIVWFIVTYPTDILYFLLAKVVKRKPFPPELAAPCRCDALGS